MNQATIELLMHPKHITNDVRELIKSDFQNQITQSIKAIHKWIEIEEYQSKDERKQLLACLDIESIVVDILSTTFMHAQSPMPFISIASMIRIDGMDKLASLKTVSELLTLLVHTKLYEIQRTKDNRYIYSLLELPFDHPLSKRVRLSCYLPPLVEKPMKIENNYQSGYHTIDDCVILGYTENQHKHKLALDTLNTLNSIEYELDTYVLNNFEKEWHREELHDDELALLSNDEQLEYHIQHQTWQQYQEQFQVLSEMLQNKTLYFLHKYDKRGRVYTQGYHFSNQGSSFEKACLNLKTKELITGEL